MKVIDFLRPWKKITFCTREFDREEYEFKIHMWTWISELLKDYEKNKIGNEDLASILGREILFVEQRGFDLRPDFVDSQIATGIVITLKEKEE